MLTNELSSSSARRASTWVTADRPNPGARFRLFCLPYAGGGAQPYRRWAASLSSEVEVCLIHLPGREQRLTEPAPPRLAPLLRDLIPALTPWLDRPFALFGHSMGGLIAFELARALRDRDLPASHLFCSATRPPQFGPHRGPDGAPIHRLPDPLFIDHLRRYGGTPEQVIASPPLLEMLLPLLRADFELCETYEYVPAAPLDCSMTAFGGAHDRYVTAADLHAWGEQITGTCTVHILPGNHFFLTTHRPQLLALLNDTLIRIIRQSPATIHR